MHIVLNVTYTLHPGAREAFLAALQQNQLLEQVRGEAGCLQYELPPWSLPTGWCCWSTGTARPIWTPIWRALPSRPSTRWMSAALM